MPHDDRYMKCEYCYRYMDEEDVTYSERLGMWVCEDCDEEEEEDEFQYQR